MKKIIILALAVMFTHVAAFAEKQTFIKDYTYHATEYDSKVSARSKAIAEVKAALLDDIGIYMESYASLIKDANSSAILTFFKDELRSTQNGIGEPVVIEESWNGNEYYIKASVTMDPDSLIRSLTKVIEHRASDAALDSLAMVLTNTQSSYIEQNQKVKELSLQVDAQQNKLYTQEDELKRLNKQLDSLNRVAEAINRQKEEANAKIAELQKSLRQLTDKALQYARVGMTYSEFKKLCGQERSSDFITDSQYHSHFARNYGGVWIVVKDKYNDNAVIEYGLSSEDFIKGNHDAKYNILKSLDY